MHSYIVISLYLIQCKCLVGLILYTTFKFLIDSNWALSFFVHDTLDRYLDGQELRSSVFWVETKNEAIRGFAVEITCRME